MQQVWSILSQYLYWSWLNQLKNKKCKMRRNTTKELVVTLNKNSNVFFRIIKKMYIKAIWGKWSINQLSSLSLSRYLTFWRFGRLSNIVHHAWFESTTDTIKIASDVSWFLNWLISCFYNDEVFIFVSFLLKSTKIKSHHYQCHVAPGSQRFEINKVFWAS